ncbi:serine/threonine-protein kinase [Nannocystis pusilla]|uniref:serine/threonine-protein kinase n=1 Tax=Nannocystis pusilla TaxID=889268 RepID=UPI003DA23094
MTALADSPFPPLDPADASPPVRELRFGLVEPLDVSPALDVDAKDDGEVVASLPLGPFAERYTLLRTLGAGGMGVVQLAYDRTACRNVAIKRIRPSYADASFTERFRREYRALAAIEHTGVPAIYDIGETSAGEPYFTMQIISGETIRARLNREKTIPPVRALALAIDLGRVLMAVHAAGVIHRDVKPDNVILEGERVRLIDFGAALLTADYYEQPHLRDVTAVGKRWRTAQVEWIGNAAYMCPQWMNEGKVSPATDVFSVCVVLYEMITGRPLYAREVYRHREIRAEEFAPEARAAGGRASTRGLAGGRASPQHGRAGPGARDRAVPSRCPGAPTFAAAHPRRVGRVVRLRRRSHRRPAAGAGRASGR